MRPRILISALAGVAALAGGASQAQPNAERVPLDHVVNVGGVDVGCTGIGQTKNDPRWLAFPVRVEFARANGNYLASEVLTVSGGGAQLSVACEGPWILLKLPAGSYQFEGQSTEADTSPVTQTVRTSGEGPQQRVIMTIPGSH
jgi:hypothetical protein